MRRESIKFYFSVEGDTEKWYLEWLSKAINESPDAKYNISLDCKIQKEPIKYVKGLSVLSRVELVHVFDRESEDAEHKGQFTKTLRSMKEAGRLRSIKYNIGYSNFAFELWMILHKLDCNGAKKHRKHYIGLINRAYGESFENLDEYKQARNFENVLKKLSLDDVLQAIRRSKAIMQHNKDVGYRLREESGFKYYEENPSLSIWEHIEKMLTKCGLSE